MKNLNKAFSILALVAAVSFTACTDDCHHCHYDDPNADIVDLGEKCGDEVADLEANGYTKDGVNYTVHCGEEH